MDSDTDTRSTTAATSRKARGICLAGFAVTAIALVGMMLALVPPASWSGWFWFRVLWMAFLSALCWVGIHGFLWSSMAGKVPPRGVGGVMPAAFMVVFWYSLASATLMLAQAFLSRFEWIGRVHLAVQIGMGGVVAVILLLMLVPLMQAERDKRHPNPKT